MRIDLGAIDRTDFNLSERDGRVLVVPRKSKHAWSEGELHLRSLLTDADGRVLSSGFPKFFNYGEYAPHDAEFIDAASRGAVTYTEKRDGTLVIADLIGYEAHLRTRGNHDLAVFDGPVRHLIRTEYPDLHRGLAERHRAMRDYSLLFEYTAPDNLVIVRYGSPELVMLGMVERSTLELARDEDAATVGALLGVPFVSTRDLPHSPTLAARHVRGWRDLEGVVARFDAPDGTRRLLKLKGEWYLALHSLRFRLSESRLRKFCFLRGVTTEAGMAALLAEMGHDFEVMDFFREPFSRYASARAEVMERFDAFRAALPRLQLACPDRRTFVAAVRQLITSGGFPDAFFHAAMRIADGREAEALGVVESLALGEQPGVVNGWLRDREAEIAAILSLPAEEAA